jgi:hypothetical protein
LTTPSSLLNAVARRTRHAGRTRLTVTSSHGRRAQIKAALQRIAKFLGELMKNAEQLTDEERWRQILSYALRKYLRRRILRAPDLIAGVSCYRRLTIEVAGVGDRRKMQTALVRKDFPELSPSLVPATDEIFGERDVDHDPYRRTNEVYYPLRTTLSSIYTKAIRGANVTAQVDARVNREFAAA